MYQWNCSLILQVKMDGELIEQNDGSLTIGLQYKAKQVSPRRSSILLPLPLTHGALSSSTEKSCGNQTVVNVWEKGTCKSPKIMALVRMLYFCATHNNFNVCVQHIPGVRNNITDALFHFQHHRFRRIAPNANRYPDIIPAWPHQAFIAASCSADFMLSPSQLGKHTNQV